jgi:hypothetical protein
MKKLKNEKNGVFIFGGNFGARAQGTYNERYFCKKG